MTFVDLEGAIGSIFNIYSTIVSIVVFLNFTSLTFHIINTRTKNHHFNSSFPLNLGNSLPTYLKRRKIRHEAKKNGSCSCPPPSFLPPHPILSPSFPSPFPPPPSPPKKPHIVPNNHPTLNPIQNSSVSSVG